MSTATLLYLFGIQNVECHSTESAITTGGLTFNKSHLFDAF